ncbi:MAG: serine--tRNA ligase [Bacteroidota bacterium]
MLQTSFIREKKQEVEDGLRKRNYSEEEIGIVSELLSIDDVRKQTQTELDSLRHESKQLASQIGEMYKQGNKDEANGLREKVGQMKETLKSLEGRLHASEEQVQALLFKLPNNPHLSVGTGFSDADNEVVEDWAGDLPVLPESAMPHWELAKKYNLIDFDLGSKITGSGFPLYRSSGAKLQRGLINFFLDEAAAAGYEEIIPPLLVNEASAKGTGQLPDKEGLMYYIEKEDFYLIPTAEVPITNIFRDVILDQSQLPAKLCGHTPCFRREAGAYGKDVRGLNRVHQFDKIEIVQVTHPDNSYKVLDEMVAHVAALLQKLELPYRVMRLCGGDLGFASALTYDFEVYSAAQKRWLEVSSVSNFETFQSNRLKLRYRDKDRKIHLAHTLNGSALALARIVAALLENNQVEDGIQIPSALRPYVGMEKIS